MWYSRGFTVELIVVWLLYIPGSTDFLERAGVAVGLAELLSSQAPGPESNGKDQAALHFHMIY